MLYYRSAYRCGLLIYLLPMEIDLNKEESTETSEFINFSIREYVSEIRSKDPKKCWPFGLLGDPDNNEVFPSESTSSKVNYGQCRHKDSVNVVAKIGNIVAVDNDEPERNRLQRKLQKFCLLSDILKNPASEFRAHCGITNPENVNKRFVSETEDESNDNVTLNELYRKQKGVEVTYPTLKKKRKTIRADQDIKSKHGLKDLTGNDLDIAPGIHSRKKARIDDIDKQTMVKRKKDCGLPCSQKMNKFTEVDNTEASKTANEDFEMEAVMLLARRFNDKNPSANEQILHELKINTSCACVQKKIRESSNLTVPKLYKTKSSKTATKNYADTNYNHPKGTKAGVFQAHVEICYSKAAEVVREAENYDTLVCSVNKNPADFSTPNAENMFMRGGG